MRVFREIKPHGQNFRSRNLLPVDCILKRKILYILRFSPHRFPYAEKLLTGTLTPDILAVCVFMCMHGYVYVYVYVVYVYVYMCMYVYAINYKQADSQSWKTTFNRIGSIS